MRQIPNILSAARLLLAPYLFWLLWRREYSLALAVIVIAGISDGLDGLLARKLNANSRIGAYLDPLADKMLLSGAFLTLALDGAIELWLAILVFGRDIVILMLAGGAFFLTKTIRNFPPSIWGKASTMAQILFVLAVIAHLGGFADNFAVMPLKWLVAALAIFSGADYIRRAALIKAKA